ncbi:unnamed protein product, partial [Musa banksii]
ANPLLDYCLGSCQIGTLLNLVAASLSKVQTYLHPSLSLSLSLSPVHSLYASVIVISLRNSLLMNFRCQKYFFFCR